MKYDTGILGGEGRRNINETLSFPNTSPNDSLPGSLQVCAGGHAKNVGLCAATHFHILIHQVIKCTRTIVRTWSYTATLDGGLSSVKARGYR